MKLPRIKRDTFVEIWPGKGEPEISILMPLYQHASYVRDAVNSLLAQRGVVAEIIISDDASSDNSFGNAKKAVKDWLEKKGSNHRIVMRHGKERLWRDNVALLVDSASCDVVCQAHSDDESHPDRARVFVETFRKGTGVTMLTSGSSFMDAEGEMLQEQKELELPIRASRYSMVQILGFPPNLIGSTQAWRKSSMKNFRRLDRKLAAMSHDRILSFRAGLCGSVVQLHAQLVKRRIHDMAWSQSMFHEPGTNNPFGWSLARMTALTVMKQDLDDALQMKMLNKQQYGRLLKIINGLFAENTKKLLTVFHAEINAGRKLSWLTDEELVKLRTYQKENK